ncbi:MAG: hypothetical protein CL670_08350 [Balneola sp.]|nr:hypothetical protein [Balneola sp.]MBE79148.1 hypothetical protein [Balneola sp.]
MINKTIQILYVAIVFVALSFTQALANGENIMVTADSTIIYDIVDEMPEIEGGVQEIYKHIDYPRGAMSAKVQGRVFIKFVVDENGEIKDPKIIKDIGAGCGDAAVKGLKKVKFSPGKLNGKAVKVYYTLPINFQITE